MIGFEFLTANRLNRLLDELVASEQGDEPAVREAVDADLAHTATEIQKLVATPRPDHAFTEALLRNILAGQRATAMPPGAEGTTGKAGTWRWSRPWVEPRHGSRPSRWTVAVSYAATAALVALTLASVWMVVNPERTPWLERQPQALLAIASPDAATSTGSASVIWESRGNADAPLDHPAALAIAPDGMVWVADTYRDRYQILSPDGDYVETWGVRGSAPGQFSFYPTDAIAQQATDTLAVGGIAFAPDGSFYVADSGNARVQKFGPDRQFLFAWGREGDGDGEFGVPSAVAVDGEGRVLVADALRNDVQVFSADGTFLHSVGEYGFEDGQLYLSAGSYLTGDGAGNFWVTDSTNKRLQKFTTEGEHVATIGGAGTTPGRFSWPGQIALDEQGRLFVADGTNRRIQVFTPDGSFSTALDGEELGPVYYPVGVALDGAGSIYVSDFHEDRVLKFRLPPAIAPGEPVVVPAELPASQPAAEPVWTSRGDPARPLNNPGHMAIDPAGNLWVVDPGAGGFQILSPDGTFLERWGEPGTEPGQFDFEVDEWPSGAVAFDASGNLYVADAGNSRVQKFSADRSFMRAWGGKGEGDGQFLQPDNLVIDTQGNVFVLDGDRDNVQVFDADGTYIRTIGRNGIGEGQFLFFDNTGLTIDRRGNLWVADVSNQRIQEFAPDGTFLATFGKFGFNAGEFSSPIGIAVDGAGRLYVVDAGKTGPRLQILSADGTVLGHWSMPGGRLADLSTAFSLALDGKGNIYITDFSNDAILKLRLLPPFGQTP